MFEEIENFYRKECANNKLNRKIIITLPYTYFGLGTLTNERASYTEENGIRHNALIFDILLDSEIPEIYNIDFEIPE